MGSSTFEDALGLFTNVVKMPLKYNIVLVPILITFSVPLLVLSFITASLSLAILVLRVISVYFDIAVEIIRDQILRPKNPSPTPTPQPVSHHRRRSSSAIALEEVHLTDSPTKLTTTEEIILPDPDFEGVGGWKIDKPDSAIHSGSSSPVLQHRRTRSTMTLDSGAPLLTSPVQLTKVRSDSAMTLGEYFNFNMPAGSSTYKAPTEGANTGKVRSRHRRGSSSSSGSVPFPGLSITSLDEKT